MINRKYLKNEKENSYNGRFLIAQNIIKQIILGPNKTVYFVYLTLCVNDCTYFIKNKWCNVFEISEIMLYLQLILNKQIIMNKDNLLLTSNGDDSKGTSADMDFNMWLLEFLDRKV